MAKPINLAFGKKLKAVRQKRGITQERLAELIKTSYKYVQRIEGKNPPDIRLSTIERISKALHVKLSTLIDH